MLKKTGEGLGWHGRTVESEPTLGVGNGSHRVPELIPPPRVGSNGRSGEAARVPKRLARLKTFCFSKSIDKSNFCSDSGSASSSISRTAELITRPRARESRLPSMCGPPTHPLPRGSRPSPTRVRHRCVWATNSPRATPFPRSCAPHQRARCHVGESSADPPVPTHTMCPSTPFIQR